MAYPEQDWFDYARATKYIHDRLPGGYNLRAMERDKKGGKVAFTKIGRRIWFKKHDLDHFISQLLITKKEAS